MASFRITLLLSFFLILVEPALADVVDCRRAGSGQYTVYIDEPAYAQSVFQTDNEMKVFMDRLWFFFDNEWERQWAEGERAPVRFSLCRGRKPCIDGSEFDAALVDLLYNQDIILEIWGTLTARRSGDHIQKRQAHIGYLLIPIRLNFYTTGSGPPGIYYAVYPRKGGAPVDDFLELFEEATHIDAYVAAALGIKHKRVGEFDLALQNLCKAKALLREIKERETSSELQKLLGFVDEAAADTIRAAKKDQAYTGALTLLDEGAACPEEETQ